ncbi:Uncharacterised protein [Legionella lansingensis]|uniref:Uncharacterized protein n=1 Tax=Legionella lansingensis TaxID=45067 RepID=A0A0W0VZ57_9GAMM|nr:hypothetical protein [Legionella lansingensis]KTD25403.1 hypothetical protein Llan_0149 [Legionella lansingensis]SNV51372.1 Uncharacterised protein [Legionella lansingensis]
MQARLEEDIRPACPLASPESNPFYLNINYLLGTHYLEGKGDTPFIYTTEITSCVGIGFFHWEQGKVKKLGLYHSSSEHIPCSDEFIIEAIKTPFERNMGMNQKNLIRAIYRFFFDIFDLNNVIVVIHSNNGPKGNNDPDNDSSYQDVVNFINHVINVMGRGDIKRENFLYSHHCPNFCVMNNGAYFAAHVDGSQDETIARNVINYIYEDILAASRKPRFLHGKNTFLEGQTKKVAPLDRKILNQIGQAKSGVIDWVEACYHINQNIAEINENDKIYKQYNKIRFMLQFLEDVNIFLRYRFQCGKHHTPHELTT